MQQTSQLIENYKMQSPVKETVETFILQVINLHNIVHSTAVHPPKNNRS